MLMFDQTLSESRARPADAAADLDRLVQIFGKNNTYVEIQNTARAPDARPEGVGV